jgi:Tfp pilus assembly protein PilV
MSDTTGSRQAQRGTTLIEALVAMLVLAFGIVAVMRAQTHLRLHADVGRQRAEAVRLAQEDLESVRAFAVAAASAGARSWADIASAASSVDGSSGMALDTTYRMARAVAADAAGSATHATVTVAWSDRTGAEQRVVLDAIVAGQDPAHAAALAIAPAGRPVKGAFGRASRVPLASRDLGGGRSVYKPSAAGGVALVFDNATGLVVARCTGVAASQRDIALSDLSSCDAHAGLLVSGVVRFSFGPSPDPGLARDTPLALSISLSLTGGLYPLAPTCTAEARRTVVVTDAAGTRELDVALTAAPADLGYSTWLDTDDRHLAYACVVYPRADGAWSGRTTLVPTGWSIGGGTSDRRVCRYAADRDGSGSVDANDEHPAAYADVRSPLANQNFLVVAGDRVCPTASGVHVAGAADDVFVDLSTLPHQP